MHAGTGELRPAATVVLMRDAQQGPEVLLARRGARGAAPDASAFPGGVVEADELPADGGTNPGGTDLGYRVAACRETFEETGLLLTRDAVPGTAVLRRARQELLARRAVFGEVLAGLGLHLAVDGLIYFARWVTPVGLPRRFDARFFLAYEAAGEAEPDGAEIVELLWATPAAALSRARAGSLRVVNATEKTLERLAIYRSVDEARAALASANVEPILPKAVRQGAGYRIVNPWEAGYAHLE